MSSRYTPFVSWSLARQKRRRYSVQAFYWTFLVFIVLAAVSWTLGALGKDGPIAQAATSAHDLFGRGSEPEVLSSAAWIWKSTGMDQANLLVCVIMYSVGWFAK